jgi:transglutaminase-like putative cysteine protease
VFDEDKDLGQESPTNPYPYRRYPLEKKGERPRTSDLLYILVILILMLVTYGLMSGVHVNDNPYQSSTDPSPVDHDNIKYYQWEYSGKSYGLDLTIAPDNYYEYHNRNTNRFPVFDDEKRLFVIPNDTIVVDLADKLNMIANESSFDREQTANLALAFCQYLNYSYDFDSTGVDEYWRYPVETLFDKTGDCEDKAILFASVTEAMGFDAVLLDGANHMAAGIALPGHVGTCFQYEGVKYSFCEATGIGYRAGVIPPDGVVVAVIQVP